MKSSSNPANTPAQPIDLSRITTYQVGGLEAAAYRSVRAFKDALLKKYGITSMQWFIIGAVLDAGTKGLRITDLSEQLDTTLGFMTNSVNLLESKNILRRIENSSDSRSRLITINKQFVPTCKKIEHELRTELRRTIYAQVTPVELHAHIKVLKLLANLEDDA